MTATSITIPAINVEGSTTIEGETTEAAFTISDIVLSDIEDGVAGMAFIEACKKSSAKNGKWTKV